MNSESNWSPRGWKQKSGWVKAPVIIVIGAAILALFTYIVMVLWNHLIPDIFHGPLITFWQALGLMVLTKILFHGISGPGGWRGKGRDWRRHWKKKWESMTPEEREKFKTNMQARCGRGPGWWDHDTTPPATAPSQETPRP